MSGAENPAYFFWALVGAQDVLHPPGRPERVHNLFFRLGLVGADAQFLADLEEGDFLFRDRDLRAGLGVPTLTRTAVGPFLNNPEPCGFLYALPLASAPAIDSKRVSTTSSASSKLSLSTLAG